MNDKNKDNSFAELVIPGDVSSARDDGMAIPPVSASKYAGKGAYSAATSQKAVEELCFSYEPDLVFIKNVKVYTWGAKRSFYERFHTDALRYRDMEGEPAEHIPFFSYIPQYSQMNLYQSRFYLYFRDMARSGEYIYADLSYILLYIYEIINLSDESDPARDIDILCGLWMAYRETYPALDKYMAEWVCDFCFLYRLPVPKATLSIRPKLCETATLREFYMSAAVEGGRIMQGEILESFADYDKRRSRVELPEEYMHHFPRAIEAACSIFDEDHFIGADATVISRDAFCGSLCAHNVKRKIVVEYYPALRRSGVRGMLGAAVKYTENKIRRVAGIKSRLHTDGLPDTAKAKIDEYFDIVMPDVFRKKITRAEPEPEYERFYDAPSTPFSADAAQKIELESRAAAEMLAAFDEVEIAVEPEPAPAPAEESKAVENTVSAVVRHMLEGGELEVWCRERGLLPDTVAGEVNEKAVDFMGDVLLENDGSGWHIIDDYLVEAAEMAVENE
ncbi:MAG: TerB N-terminal domain-containing protein [Clostridia bacterium]|nr:TerB N-terminal domain-containing protein [Clostridia bacterium]